MKENEKIIQANVFFMIFRWIFFFCIEMKVEISTLEWILICRSYILENWFSFFFFLYKKLKLTNNKCQIRMSTMIVHRSICKLRAFFYSELNLHKYESMFLFRFPLQIYAILTRKQTNNSTLKKGCIMIGAFSALIKLCLIVNNMH